ncbi:hypothetical protein I553_10270 [Mycobacterium xenopi 4042]|uniref:Uncharacterized protein n=1 Tax=Mycobacterium xenopi 4042 TaxID=1299334 RepID=X8AM31_MYCXE|nr:hypothetical protein I553_10270 [Mycobacterium xenopi 4042]
MEDIPNTRTAAPFFTTEVHFYGLKCRGVAVARRQRCPYPLTESRHAKLRAVGPSSCRSVRPRQYQPRRGVADREIGEASAASGDHRCRCAGSGRRRRRSRPSGASPREHPQCVTNATDPCPPPPGGSPARKTNSNNSRRINLESTSFASRPARSEHSATAS